VSEGKSLYLVKVEPNANNNKYYKMIAVGDSFEVQYGRIGNINYQSKTYPLSKWDSTLRSKLKKGYVDQTRLVAEPVVEKKENPYLNIDIPEIEMIVEKLQQMASKAIKDNYTISSSNVTEVMIKEAQVFLNDLNNIDKFNNSLEKFNDILLELFKTIPRKMHKVKNCLAVTTDEFGVIIEREQDLLDVMKGQVSQHVMSKATDKNNETTHTPKETILEALGLEFKLVNDKDIEIIKDSLGNIKDRFHRAWKVVNVKTQKAFDGFVKDNKIKNTKLLWHGSRNENWWSIIGAGLVLRPNAVITGKMFGYGIYYAPNPKKSLGYTSLQGSYWARGSSSSAFMGLYDVAYGKAYDVHDFNSRYYDLNYEKLQKMSHGSNCLHAHADKGMLRNDEIIIYKEEQCTIKYLVELK